MRTKEPKTERVETRTSPTQLEQLSQAADAVGESLAAFVMNAASVRAKHILSEVSVTPLLPEQYDWLVSTINEPDEVSPEVVRAYANTQPIVRLP